MPQGFTGYAELKHIADTRYAYLMHSLGYVDAAGALHLSPAWYKTDGGSIPSWAWSGRLGTPYTMYLRAYLVHDPECEDAETRLYETGDAEAYKRERAAADSNFLEMMEWIDVQRNESGPDVPKRVRLASWYRRRKFYRGVQIGGKATLAKWRKVTSIKS